MDHQEKLTEDQLLASYCNFFHKQLEKTEHKSSTVVDESSAPVIKNFAYYQKTVEKDPSMLLQCCKPDRANLRSVLQKVYLHPDFTDYPSYLAARQNYENLFLEQVRKDGLLLRYIKEQSRAVQWAAIRQNPEALQYVTNQIPKMVKYVVDRDPNCIRFCRIQRSNIYAYAASFGSKMNLPNWRDWAEFRYSHQIKHQCSFCGVFGRDNFYQCNKGHYIHVQCRKRHNNMNNYCLMECPGKLISADSTLNQEYDY